MARTYKEIFCDLKADKIKGIMYHEQLRNAFNLLNLGGFKRWQEFRLGKETKELIDTNRFFVEEYGMLIDDSIIDDPKAIPKSWFNIERNSIDTSTIRRAVKDLFEVWCKWEENVRKNLYNYFIELTEIDEIEAANFVNKMICDNDEELKYIKRIKMKLQNVDYDIVYITLIQDKMHDCYKEKMKEIF